MTAFVVDAPTGPPSHLRPGSRLNIFPGSATPAVFAAGAPFWIGYGFVPEASDTEASQATIAPDTRFELFVDGRAVLLYTDLRVERGRTVQKFTLAAFPNGLAAGWHVLAGRWYDEGVLTLTSDRSTEFVER